MPRKNPKNRVKTFQQKALTAVAASRKRTATRSAAVKSRRATQSKQIAGVKAKAKRAAASRGVKIQVSSFTYTPAKTSLLANMTMKMVKKSGGGLVRIPRDTAANLVIMKKVYGPKAKLKHFAGGHR